MEGQAVLHATDVLSLIWMPILSAQCEKFTPGKSKVPNPRPCNVFMVITQDVHAKPTPLEMPDHG